jgi:ribosomal protein S6--L-glutamate ligase
LIRTQTGSKVLEVNSSPGLEGLENISKKNVAEKIIAHIEKSVPSTNWQKRSRK